MSHLYKQVAPKQPEPLSFVELVTKYGDLWQCGLPHGVQSSFDSVRGDEREAANMYYMETGLFPRVKHEDLQG